MDLEQGDKWINEGSKIYWPSTRAASHIAWIWILEPALLPLWRYVSDPVCLSFLTCEMEIIKWEGASQMFNPFLDTK